MTFLPFEIGFDRYCGGFDGMFGVQALWNRRNFDFAG